MQNNCYFHTLLPGMQNCTISLWKGLDVSLNFKYVSKPSFLRLNTTEIFGQMVLCYGSCPVHSKMSWSVPGLYLSDATSTSTFMTKMPPNIVKCPLECKIVPSWKPLSYSMAKPLNNLITYWKENTFPKRLVHKNPYHVFS